VRRLTLGQPPPEKPEKPKQSAEDALLLALLFLLWQEKADPFLLAALVYILLDR